MTEENQITPDNGEDEAKEVTRSESEAASPGCPTCAKVAAERDEYKAGWQRERADYLNLQKDAERDKAEWASWSKRLILAGLLPVYDNFKKALAHRPEKSDTAQWTGWADGVGLIMKQFSELLKNHEVEEIKTVGARFDPALHEIVAEEPSDEYPEHVVIREVEGGYTLGGKVFKVAKVVVAGRQAAGAL